LQVPYLSDYVFAVDEVATAVCPLKAGKNDGGLTLFTNPVKISH